MRARHFLIFFFTAALSAQSLPLSDILARISEEADVFRSNAPKLLAEETLNQRCLKVHSRFQPRAGTAAAPVDAETATYRERQIVSEYSYAGLREGNQGLHEFRQVISVDGKVVKTVEKARRALSLGLRSEDDRLRKRMLEDFRKYGLTDAATDFGQILLLFSKRQLHDYDFRVGAATRIGADEVLEVTWEQRGDKDKLVVFQGRQTVRSRMQGSIWVRKADGLPLRISMKSEWLEQGSMRVHEATVEYRLTAFGVLAPASVSHKEYLDRLLLTENEYRYGTFRQFGADAEIKFDAVPDPPPAK